MKNHIFAAVLAAVCLTAAVATAHDTWLQTNVPLIRTGDAIDVDLMLGNHGNAHRDFKLAGKVRLAGSSVDLIAPDSVRTDLRPRLADRGMTPTDG